MTHPDTADSKPAMMDDLTRAYQRIAELEKELSQLRQRYGIDSRPPGSASDSSQTRPKVTSVGSWEYAVESGELFWTSQIKAIHEVPLDYEPTLSSALGFFSPDSAEAAKTAFEAVLRGQSFDMEAQIVTFTGRTIWVRVIGNAKVRAGKVVKVYGAMQDIDARKRVEEALMVSEAQLRELIRYVPIAIAMLDDQMRCLHVNDRWLEAYNLVGQNIIGKSYYEIFPTLDEEWRAIHQLCLQGEISRRERDAFPRADGGIDWVRWEMRPWYRRENEVGGLLIYSEIITERVKMLDDLAAAEQNVSAVINNTADSIWSVGRDYRVITINEPFRESFHKVYGIELQTGDYILDKLGPEQEAEWRGYYERALLGETFKVEKHYTAPDLRFEIFTEISFNPIRNEQGQVTGVAVYSRDITERKKAEQALRTREAQLAEMVRSLPTAVAMFDKDMRYLHASPVWYSSYQLAERDVTGKSHYEVFPEIGDDWKQIHQRCLRGEINRSEREPFVRADGTLDWLRWEVRPWYSQPNEVGGLLMYTEVITSRINDEDVLRRSEALLNATQRMARVGGWEFDLRTNELLWTSETKNIHEVEPDYQPALVSALNFFIPDHEPILRHAMNDASQGKPFDLELQLVTAKGRRIWVRIAGDTEFEDGKPIKIYGALQDIDDRKRAENAIRESQQQLASTSNNIPGAIYRVIIHDPHHWTIDYMSEGIFKMAGVSAQEVVEDVQAFIRQLHPDDVEGFLDSLRTVRDRNGTIWYYEGRLIHRITGQIKWWQGRSILAELGDGRIVFNGVLLDITDTRETEAKLRQSEAKLREAEAVAHIGNFEFDLVSSEIIWSDEMYHLFGLEVGSKMTLPTFRSLVPAEDYPALVEGLNHSRESGEAYRVEHRAILPDGSHRHLYTIGQPITDHTGKVVKVFGTSQDMTERKAAEAERERLLARTELLYQISQALNQVHHEADLVNQLGKALDGYDVNIINLLRLDEEGVEPAPTLELVATWARDGRPIVPFGSRFPASRFTFIESILRQPLEPRAYDIDRHPALDENTRGFLQKLGDRTLVNIPLRLSGHWVGVILLLWHELHVPSDDELAIYRTLPALISPIADNIRLVRNLEETVRELNQSLLFKDQFLATMSHELRTPMNAIMGYSSIALQREGVPENVRNMLQRVLVNSDRLLRLITDILDISRINAGRVQLVHDPYALHKLVKGWAQDFSRPIAEKGLIFDFRMDESLPVTAVGDEERITQIANNLLSNAIKFTDEGKIGLYVTRTDDKLVIRVTDTGIGIPQTYQHLIFEEFRQVDMTPERRHGGTGLGLAIVQKLCILMGGTVVVESEVGKGSTFTVTLPLQTANSEGEGDSHG